MEHRRSLRRARRYRARRAAVPREAVPPTQEGERLATNTGVRLACTMAAMLSLFALFLCWAERDSRVIRRFALQSAALMMTHALCGAFFALVGFLLRGIPFLGFLVSLLCYLGYFACLVALMIVRVRLMERAWHGQRYELPFLQRYVDRIQ